MGGSKKAKTPLRNLKMVPNPESQWKLSRSRPEDGLETFTLRKNFLPTLRSTFYDILWYAVSKIEESQANFKRILIGKVQFFRRPQNIEKSPNVFYITISQFKKHFSTFYDFPRISELTRL